MYINFKEIYSKVLKTNIDLTNTTYYFSNMSHICNRFLNFLQDSKHCITHKQMPITVYYSKVNE